MPVYTASYDVEWKPSGTWTAIADNAILSVTGDLQTTGNRDNALAFGDEAAASCSIDVRRAAISLTTWQDVPIRVTYTRGAVTERAFTGVIAGYDSDLDVVTFDCRGFADVIRKRTKDLYSGAFYRRPVATKTSISSIEDPSNGNYNAGLINWILWQAGGRPVEQDFSYPSATFYYSCDQAILAPDWSWVAGENGWDEALRLARSSGGQLYQDRDGTVTFKQPLSFASGAATYTFTQSVYADAHETVSTDQLATKIVCSYVPRIARPMQEIINDATPRLVQGSGSVSFDLEPQWPLRSVDLDAGALKADHISATFLDGRAVPKNGTTGWSGTVTTTAQKITVTITNNTIVPFVINRVVFRGEPITPGEGGTVSSGSGTVVRTLEENPYIQSRSHAQRLCDMTVAFYNAARSLRTLSECPYDPDRYVGETVYLTVPEWNVSAEPHLIVAMRHDDTGTTADYDLVSVSGLPKTSDYFIVGTTDYTGQTKKLGF